MEYSTVNRSLSSSLVLRLPLLLIYIPFSFSQPQSWIPKIKANDMLYTTTDSNIDPTNMPMIGNGFAATQVSADSIYVSGIFNGYLTQDPSHHARIPATNAVKPPGSTVTDAALDVREATYYRRSFIGYASNCTNASLVSCTTASSGVTIEQRWYAHRVLASVMVMEIQMLPADNISVSKDTDPSSINYGNDNSDSLFAMVSLINNPGASSTDINTSTYSPIPPTAPYTIYLMNTLIPETMNGTIHYLAMATTNFPPNNMLYVPSSLAYSTFYYLTVIRTSTETPINNLPEAVSADYYTAITLAEQGILHSSHINEWATTVWQSGLETDRGDAARALNTSIYSIMSSVRNDRPFSISPGGLSDNSYNSHTFWDCETFVFPGILLLFPDIATSNFLEYRVARLDGAREKAQSYSPPYSGAMMPWESAETGEETCPSWAATGLREIHINGDIPFAVRQFWRVTQDSTTGWLEYVAWPLVSGIADFWVSKAVIDNPGVSIKGWTTYPDTLRQQGIFGANAEDAPLHINDVIPPDEYVDHVNDSVYTNAGAILALNLAVDIAQLLNYNSTVYAAWADTASRIVMLFNASGPNVPAGGVHPEYAGYYNTTVKQADTILLGFPLEITFGNMTPQVRANDLAWYEKVTDFVNGPSMSAGMFSVSYVELGNYEQAAFTFNLSFANAQPPFDVWRETPNGGVANFLTGAGGYLQTLAFGYPGLRFNDTALTLNPYMLENGNIVSIRGMNYLGNRLDISYTTTTLSVTVQASMTNEAMFNTRYDGSIGNDHNYAPSCASTGSRICEEVWKNDIEQQYTAKELHNLLYPTAQLSAFERNQIGRVRFANGHILKIQPLTLIDSTGKTYPLVSGNTVNLPLQRINIVGASNMD